MTVRPLVARARRRRRRDAVFIVNDEDMRALKQVIKARWLARRMKRYPGVDVEEFRAQVDRDVEKRFIENYAWFAHRVRRLIIQPNLRVGLQKGRLRLEALTRLHANSSMR